MPTILVQLLVKREGTAVDVLWVSGKVCVAFNASGARVTIDGAFFLGGNWGDQRHEKEKDAEHLQ